MGGRALPLRQWEGEVMVRAVGLLTILQNALGLVFGPLASFLRWRQQNASSAFPMAHEVIPALIRVACILAGRDVLRRGRGGRIGVILLNGLSLTCLALAMVLAPGMRAAMGSAMVQHGLLSLLSIWAVCVSMLFSLYVLAVFPGGSAFKPPLLSQALAPLRSVRDVPASLRGWVALGMVALVPIAFLLGLIQVLL